MSERQKPALLRVLAGLVLLEGVALAVAAIYVVFEIFVAPTASLASAIAFAVVIGIGAVALIFIARSLWQGRSWVRAPIIAWHILQLLVGVSILQSGAPSAVPVALLVAVPALLILVALFLPPVWGVLASSAKSGERDRTF